MRAPRLILVGLLFTSIVVVPATALAETEAQLKAQLQEIQQDTRRAGDACSDALEDLEDADTRYTSVNKRVKKTTKELKRAKHRLNTHAASVYKRDSLDLVDFLFGSSSFTQFATRMDLLGRIGELDAESVAQVKALNSRLKTQRSQLRDERDKRAKKAASLKKKRDRLQKRLDAKEAEFKEVKRKLARLRSAGGSAGGGMAVAGPNGMVFPVGGSYYYSNTWHAPRTGHLHQGTDIMARTGTPVYATLSGTVSVQRGGSAGLWIILRANNGWQFWYMHLNSTSVRSGSQVKVGQQIGTVGYSGNASQGAPHLHYEIHPGGGGATNPYPYLRAME